MKKLNSVVQSTQDITSANWKKHSLMTRAEKRLALSIIDKVSIRRETLLQPTVVQEPADSSFNLLKNY
jgi:hypothetical protein